MVASIGSNGVDVNAIVQQLMTVENQSITKLNAKEAVYQAKLSAIGTIKGAVSNFEGVMNKLGNVSAFQSNIASSSDSTKVSATTSMNAAAGKYSIEVLALARSQTVVANGKADVTASIGTGVPTTISLDMGSISGTSVAGKYNSGTTFISNGTGVRSMVIDASNNSLQGIRDAINASASGITANIINDGGASPYRLVITSTNAGSNQSVKISVSGDATISSLLSQDPTSPTGQNLTETIAAQNTDITVNGVPVSKPSTLISDVMQGVSINVKGLTSGTPIVIDVTKDKTAMATAVNDFIKAFNGLSTELSRVSSYDPATKKGAILQGDATVRMVQSRLRDILNKPVNDSGSITNLSQIGVTFQRDGTLALDAARFDKIVSSNFKDMAKLFAVSGSATDSLIGFNAATSATATGTYSVDVSSLATKASAVGSISPSSLVIDGTNNQFTMNVRGISTSINLTQGTYGSIQALASELQTQINGNASMMSASALVTASVNASNQMMVETNQYGSSATFTFSGGNGVFNMLGTPTSTSGSDAAGTVNGNTAQGYGQALTSTSGASSGLSIRVLGGSLGARGMVSYSEGYASILGTMSKDLLSSNGVFQSSMNALDGMVSQISKNRTDTQQRLMGVEARYRAQFTALDNLLNSMNATSSFLTRQLATTSNTGGL